MLDAAMHLCTLPFMSKRVMPQLEMSLLVNNLINVKN